MNWWFPVLPFSVSRETTCSEKPTDQDAIYDESTDEESGASEPAAGERVILTLFKLSLGLTTINRNQSKKKKYDERFSVKLIKYF